jgi:hypothetical protein
MPGCFNPQERAESTQYVEGWVGMKAGQDSTEKRNIPYPCWDSNSDFFNFQPTK